MSPNPYQDRVRERFYRLLLERNLKLTKPRKALIDHLIRKRGWHFQAEELLDELNERSPGVVSRARFSRRGCAQGLGRLLDRGRPTRNRVRP